MNQLSFFLSSIKVGVIHTIKANIYQAYYYNYNFSWLLINLWSYTAALSQPLKLAVHPAEESPLPRTPCLLSRLPQQVQILNYTQAYIHSQPTYILTKLQLTNLPRKMLGKQAIIPRHLISLGEQQYILRKTYQSTIHYKRLFAVPHQ